MVALAQSSITRCAPTRLSSRTGNVDRDCLKWVSSGRGTPVAADRCARPPAHAFFEKQTDGKIRVTSGSWDYEKVILPNEVVEVRSFCDVRVTSAFSLDSDQIADIMSRQRRAISRHDGLDLRCLLCP
jgi:hypothetical protein